MIISGEVILPPFPANEHIIDIDIEEVGNMAALAFVAIVSKTLQIRYIDWVGYLNLRSGVSAGLGKIRHLTNNY